MPIKNRLLFILPNLDGGGAERVVLTLLKNLDREAYEYHLAVVNNFGKFINDVPGDVIFHDLKAVRVRKSFLPILRLVLRLKPKILFSTLGHLNLALILLKLFLPRQTKLIIRETVIVSDNLKGLPYDWAWKGLYRHLYNQANAIICLCNSMIDDLREHFNVSSKKMIRIYNPIDMGSIKNKADQGENPFQFFGPGPHVVAAGRLSFQKGFDLLIQAFPALLVKKPNARLWVLGQGELNGELRELIYKLGLDEKITLTGFQSNPFVWFKHADLFVLSSRFEGLPNTLLEVLVCGCPVVALHHPGGTEEVLRTLDLGDRYVNSLEVWASGWWQRPHPGVERALLENFGVKRIIQEYEALFNQEN